MINLMCISIHRYVSFLFVLVIVVSAVIYLIMVNVVYSKIPLHPESFDVSNDYTIFKSNSAFARGDVNNTRPSVAIQSGLRDQNMKLILLWTPLFEGWSFLQVGKDSFRSSSCPKTRCEITSDRKRLLESDAVLFHIRTLSMFDLPEVRRPSQKWIFFSLEAPPYSRFQGFDFMSNMFNWTMTYRKDSDIYIPYGRIVSKRTKDFSYSKLYTRWKAKSKLAVWMVSHCETSGNREKFISQLTNFMDIDTYGSCGIGTCPFNKTNLCIENFSKQYYFFLAFENAICNDYITEKFFRTLQYDMIPVVFGGGNYTAMAPPNSFIDALDFSSPKQLSSHLLKISSNFTLFSSYFKWRANGYSDDVPDHCELCEKLHSEDFKKFSVYRDVNEWWVKKSNCKVWNNGHSAKQYHLQITNEYSNISGGPRDP